MMIPLPTFKPNISEVKPEDKNSGNNDSLVCFVKEQFPKKSSEYRSDYYPIGNRCFRINFWTKSSNQSKMSEASSITRSLFVYIAMDEMGQYKIEKVCEN